VDRTGFVLSEGRGLDPGIQALASHLTALLPPVPGTVRIRARAVVAGERAPAHVGTGGRRRVDAVVDASPSKDALPSTRAAVVGQVAASGLAGSIDDLLGAANLLVEGADLRSVPAAPNDLTDALVQLARLTG
jgi:hypothetical protein